MFNFDIHQLVTASEWQNDCSVIATVLAKIDARTHRVTEWKGNRKQRTEGVLGSTGKHVHLLKNVVCMEMEVVNWLPSTLRSLGVYIRSTREPYIIQAVASVEQQPSGKKLLLKMKISISNYYFLCFFLRFRISIYMIWYWNALDVLFKHRLNIKKLNDKKNHSSGNKPWNSTKK